MSFAYSRTLTIDHTKCGSSNRTDFPVLVRISDASFKHTSGGGRITSTSGYDIIFTSDSAGTTKVPWEIDQYDSANGVLYAWVKLATVSYTVDTVFYIWFGDATVTTAQNTGAYAPTNVWSNSYQAVYHLSDGQTLSGYESKYGNTATIGSGITATSAQLGGGASFSNTFNQSVKSAGYGMGWTSWTFSAWLTTATTTGTKAIFDTSGGGGGSWGITVEGTIPVVQYINRGGVGFNTLSMTANKLYYLVITTASNGGNPTATLYDPVAMTYVSETVTGTSWNWSGGNFTIGQVNLSGTLRNHYGKIDEVRVSTVVRSADWSLTEFNNQVAPGNIGTPGFITFGAETGSGGPTGINSTETATPVATEGTMLAAASTRSDTATPAVSEVKMLAAASTRSDTSTPTITEARTLAASSARTDTATPTATEARNLTAKSNRVDTVTPVVAESRSLLARFFRSETVQPVFTSLAGILGAFLSLFRSDTATPIASESRTLAARSNRVDTTAPIATESRNLTAQSNRTDTATPTATEARTLAARSTRTDTATPTATEGRNLTAQSNRVDTVTPTVTESRSLFVRLFRTEVINTLITESRSVFAWLTTSDLVKPLLAYNLIRRLLQLVIKRTVRLDRIDATPARMSTVDATIHGLEPVEAVAVLTPIDGSGNAFERIQASPRSL